MSADLTPAELARCRVRLAELPGCDPVGLVGHEDGHDNHRRLILRDAGKVFASEFVMLASPVSTEFVPARRVWLSTTDASTRDRLARFLVDVPTMTAPAFAVSWEEEIDDPGHATDPRGFIVWLGEKAIAASTSGAAEWFDTRHMPTLGDLNPDDPRLLPDGTLWVEAAMLAEVVRYLGGIRG